MYWTQDLSIKSPISRTLTLDPALKMKKKFETLPGEEKLKESVKGRLTLKEMLKEDL